MKKYIELIYRMTEMTEKDKQNLIDLMDKLDEKYNINSIEDMDKINNIKLDNINIENIEELMEIPWENLDLSNLSLDDIEFNTDEDYEYKSPLDDYIARKEDLYDDKVNADDFKYNKPDKSTNDENMKDEIEININNNEKKDKPYIGENWLEIDNKYMTYIKLDSDLDVSDINIQLRDSYVIFKEIDKKISTKELPLDVNNLDASLTGKNRILIKVW